MENELLKQRQNDALPEDAPESDAREYKESFKMTMAKRMRPHGASLVIPGKERDEMRESLDALRQEHDQLIVANDAAKNGGGIEVEKKAATALAAYELHALDFEMKRDSLLNATVSRISSALQLPVSDAADLKKLLELSIIAHPADAPTDVASTREELSKRRVGLLRLMSAFVLDDQPRTSAEDRATVVADWNEYKRDIAAYESDLESRGAESFARSIGIDGTVPNVRAFIAEVTSPLPDLRSASPEIRSNPRMIALAERLEAQRADMAVLLPSMATTGTDYGEEMSWAVTEYLASRNAYSSAVLGRIDDTDPFALYGMIVAGELFEEGVEAIPQLKIGKRLTFLRGLVGPVRLEMLQGIRAMQQKGFGLGEIGKAIDVFARSPLGPKFWNSLLEVESAATILLWGMYLHNSPNKFEASIQFGSFIALSNAVSKASGAVTEALSGIEGLSALRMIKIPGANFAIQFAVAMTVAFLAADQIQKFAHWVDETIPDSALKSEATVALGIVSGEPIFSGLEELSEVTGFTEVLDKAGMTGFDPDRDLMSYLGAEAISVKYPDMTADYRRIHTIHDWNDRLRMAINAQDNEIKQALWETLRVDAGSWADRQALQVFSTVSSLRQSETSLEQSLRKAGVFTDSDRLTGVHFATADYDMPSVVGMTGYSFIKDDMHNRNDRLVARAFDWADGKLVKAGKYFRSLPESDPNREAWTIYEKSCAQLAKNISIYRHLDIYNQKAWLGDVEKLGGTSGLQGMTDTVRNGLMAEVRHQMRRRALLSSDAYPKLSRREFAEKLVGTVKLKPEFSFLESGFLSIKDPQGFEGMMKRARSDYFSLLFTVQDAEKTLTKEKLDACLQPLREIVLAGQMPTGPVLRSAQKAINDAIIDHVLRKEPLVEAPADVRSDLAAPENFPVLFQGDPNAAVYEYTREVNDFSLSDLNPFGAKREPTYVQEKIRPFDDMYVKEHEKEKEGLYSVSMQIARARDDGGFFRQYQVLSFDCPSSDRRTWKILVRQKRLMTTHFKKEDGVKYIVHYSVRNDPDEVMSFEKWQKANLEAAVQIEPRLRAIQEGRKQSEVRVELEKELGQQEMAFVAFSAPVLAMGPRDTASAVPLAYGTVFGEQYGEAAVRQKAIRDRWEAVMKDETVKKMFAGMFAVDMRDQRGLDMRLVALGSERDRAMELSERVDIVARQKLATVHNVLAESSRNTYPASIALLRSCNELAELVSRQEDFLKRHREDPHEWGVLRVASWGTDLKDVKDGAAIFRYGPSTVVKASPSIDFSLRGEDSDLLAVYRMVRGLGIESPDEIRVEARTSKVEGKAIRQYHIVVVAKGNAERPGAERPTYEVAVPGWRDERGALKVGLPEYKRVK